MIILSIRADCARWRGALGMFFFMMILQPLTPAVGCGSSGKRSRDVCERARSAALRNPIFARATTVVVRSFLSRVDPSSDGREHLGFVSCCCPTYRRRAGLQDHDEEDMPSPVRHRAQTAQPAWYDHFTSCHGQQRAAGPICARPQSSPTTLEPALAKPF